MRGYCYDCTRKHLSAAIPYMNEEELGYRGYGWMAVGEMTHAEGEIIRASVSVAEAIRAARVQYIEYLNSKERNIENVPDMFPLIMMVTTLHELAVQEEAEETANLFNQPEK